MSSLEVLDLDDEDEVGYEEAPCLSRYTMDVRRREAQESIERGIEISNYISDIISLINSEGTGLEGFKWTNSYSVQYIRANEFWDALWRTAGNLKSLELGFYKDELAVDMHGLRVNPPPSKLTVLTTLFMDVSNAHGHNGTLIDNILLSSPSLQTLILHLTLCDLSNCGIQNITWSYTFPSLTSLTILFHTSANGAISSFLSRHPTIKSLAWGLYSDPETPFIFLPGHLPLLQRLNIRVDQKNEDMYRHVLLGPTPLWKILELKISNFSYGYKLILALSSTLSVLELDIGVTNWREGTYSFRAEEKADIEMEREREKISGLTEEDMTDEYIEEAQEPLQILLKNVLRKLDGLKVLNVGLESGDLYSRNKLTGEFENLEPMGAEELNSLLSALADSTSIQTLKMSDSRGLPLKSINFDQNTPKSLEVLEWNVGKGNGGARTYHLQRLGSRVEFVKQK